MELRSLKTRAIAKAIGLVEVLLLTTSCGFPCRISEADRNVLLPTTSGRIQFYDALKYANKVKDNYNKFTLHHANWLSTLETVVFLTSGAAIGVAATGGSTNLIAGLGIGSATALGYGARVQNKPKQMVYRTGINTIQCVINKMEVYGVAKGTEDSINQSYVNLTKLNNELNDAIIALDKEATAADVAAKGTILEARGTYDKVAGTLSNANVVRQSLAKAGLSIVNAVDTIDNQVTTAALQAEPDISTLQSSLTNGVMLPAQQVYGITNPFKQAGAAAAGTTRSVERSINDAISKRARSRAKGGGAQQPPSHEEILLNRLIALKEAVANVQTENSRLGTLVSVINVASSPGIEECLNQNKSELNRQSISIVPSDSIEVKGTGTTSFVILGGNPPLTLTRMSKSEEDFDMATNSTVGGLSVSVTGKKDDTAVGPDFVRVKDNSGVEKTFSVTVKKKD